MCAKLDNIATFTTELKAFQHQRQALEYNTQRQPPEILSEGQLVYLLPPSAASLQTNTKKCRVDYVGPLIINKVLDETHYVLNDLQGRILCGVYHINHLTKAKLCTSSGTATTYDELWDTFSHSQDTEVATPLPDVAPATAFQSLFNLNNYKPSPFSTCDCPPATMFLLFVNEEYIDYNIFLHMIFY